MESCRSHSSLISWLAELFLTLLREDSLNRASSRMLATIVVNVPGSVVMISGVSFCPNGVDGGG